MPDQNAIEFQLPVVTKYVAIVKFPQACKRAQLLTTETRPLLTTTAKRIASLCSKTSYHSLIDCAPGQVF